MPYRVDVPRADDAVLDRLVELGALDVDRSPGGGIAALMPDSVAPDQVAYALGLDDLSIAPAIGRDTDSVWILTPRAIRIGRLRIVPADASAEPGVLRLTDSPAFGTGLHATTAMCLEVIDEALEHSTPGAVLDVGTGSGVLALAALLMGVPRALGLDIDAGALRAAAENARLNGLNNVRYEPISVEAWLKYKSAEFPTPDFVLLDPPRAGAGVNVIERLAAMDPPTVTYISCDPATLARDLRLLIDYGYRIDSLTALDMFPQTFHVETVVRLRIED